VLSSDTVARILISVPINVISVLFSVSVPSTILIPVGTVVGSTILHTTVGVVTTALVLSLISAVNTALCPRCKLFTLAGVVIAIVSLLSASTLTAVDALLAAICAAGNSASSSASCAAVKLFSVKLH